MSFLIDPPWLYATGQAYGRLMPEPTRMSRALTGATLGAFLATSVSLYLDRPWTEPIWRACRAESGRDWMLNSGVLRFDAREPSRRVHALSALAFASYPVWMWLGLRHARRVSPRLHSHRAGLASNGHQRRDADLAGLRLASDRPGF